MTAVELPNFIIQLFKAEIAEIQASLIHEICKDYDLDSEELIAKYINMDDHIEILSSKIMKLSITKCQPEIDSELRCDARTWNNGTGARCKRKRVEDAHLCSHHKKKADNNILKYGLITEPRPPIFKNLLRKKKLY